MPFIIVDKTSNMVEHYDSVSLFNADTNETTEDPMDVLRIEELTEGVHLGARALGSNDTSVLAAVKTEVITLLRNRR